MPGYTPFLLPLLSGQHLNDGQRLDPGSPLEEERAITDALPDPGGIWKTLEQMTPKRYGLPLLLEDPRPPVSHTLVRCPRAVSPARCMRLKSAGGERFLLEHPEALSTFDRLGGPGATAALLRPSLFSRMYRVLENEGCEIATTTRGDATAHDLGRVINDIAGTGASDWHLEPAADAFRSRIRVDGMMRPNGVYSRERGDWLVNSLITRAGIRESSPGKPLEGAFSHTLPDRVEIGLRLSLVPALHGRSMVIRFLYPANPARRSLEKLGLEGDQARTIRNRYAQADGLWLMAGPTGSGKSTTQHALLDLSVDRNEKVLSVEDPVEMIHPGVQQVSIGKPPGMTYARALRSFLRQGPDTILVGEIRDPETAAICLQAARSGHRILATVHARNDRGILQRFADLGQDGPALEAVCCMVLHQRLVPRLCPTCRTTRETPEAVRCHFHALGLEAPERLASAAGCRLCRSGYCGRSGIFSVGGLSAGKDVAGDLRGRAVILAGKLETPLTALVPFLPAEMRGFALCQR